MCRNQSEVSTILNSTEEDSDDEELDEQTFEEGIPNLARLRLAVNYNQKQVRHSLLQVTKNRKRLTVLGLCVKEIVHQKKE